MKTVVSIPDEISEKEERLAERERRSWSEAHAAALREYVARHGAGRNHRRINRVCDQVGTAGNEFRPW